MNIKSPNTSMALWAISVTMLGLIATVVIQATSTAYAFGKLTNKVDDNRTAIVILVNREKTLSALTRKVAVLKQKLVDDEEILHSIARAVGAKGEIK